MLPKAIQKLISSTTATLWLFLVLLVAVVGVAEWSIPGNSATNTWRQATTHQPEVYDELYFDNPDRLPTYAPAGKLQTINFHIVNHQGRPKTYAYVATLTIDGVVKTYMGSAMIADNQGKLETITFTMPAPNKTANVAVALVGTNLHLTFRSRS